MIPSQLFAVSGGDDDYQIPYSLRLRASASSYLRRIFSTGNIHKGSISFWCKRGNLGTLMNIISTGNTASTYAALYFDTNNKLNFYVYNSGVIAQIITTKVFRDPSAHYNILLNWDSTNPVSSERIKIYVNGELITSFTTATYPALNADMYLLDGDGSTPTQIGYYPTTGNYFDGYISEFIAVYGEVLGPEWFGKFNTNTSQWVPIKYTGTYGANGFLLQFKDATSLVNLGNDTSGNNNHWTLNNISLVAGVNYDSMIDTPTNNFPTFDQLGLNLGTRTISGANMFTSNGGNGSTYANKGMSSGKWYVELKLNALTYLATSTIFGLCANNRQNNDNAQNYTPSVSYVSDGTKRIDGVNTAYGATYTAGDVLAIAIDIDNGTLEFFKNNVSQGVINKTLLGAGNGLWRLFVVAAAGSATNSWYVNFGQQPFTYDAPDGFKAFCTKNLPIPTVKRGDKGLDIVTYTGNGSNLQVGEYQFPRPSYLIPKSLRFKGVNSYLNRIPSVIGDYKKLTWSGWVKISSFPTTSNVLFNSGAPGNNSTLGFYGDKISIRQAENNIITRNIQSNFSVPTDEWFHIFYVIDTTELIESDRVKIWFNGNAVTSFSNNTTFTYQDDTWFNGIRSHSLGSLLTASFIKGYLAEVNYIDGQALDPSDFGEFDISGYWIPKAYAGTYGQNGFYLDFEDTAAVANLGYDKSGQGNNWSVNNISLTSGVNYDSMDDSPTNNFATLNVLDKGTSIVLYDGGLRAGASSAAGVGFARSTYDIKGKKYCEMSPTLLPASSAPYFGFCTDLADPSSTDGLNLLYYNYNGVIYLNTVAIATVATLSVNDVIGLAYDKDNDLATIYKNGVQQWQGNLGFKDSKVYFFAGDGSANAVEVTANFGQRPFSYTVPTGYDTLSYANMSQDEYGYDLEFPSVVLIKCRNAAQNFMLFDAVRGVNNYLSTNLTAANAIDVNSLINFNKNGFYLGNNANVNTLNNTYAAYMWNVSKESLTNNNDGSKLSQILVNRAYGISVVEWTGNAVAGTVGHGLGVPPAFIIHKGHGVSGWPTYHKNQHAVNPQNGVIYLNTSAAFVTNTMFNNTYPTSQVFSVVGAGSTELNMNGVEFTTYCFAEVEGYSKFNSYIGNGNAEGPVVECGFKPRFLLIKRVDAASDWFLWDTERDKINPMDGYLLLDTTGSETGSANLDITSNGFKLRNSSIVNVSGATYIFAAFAECPIKYSTAM